MKRKKLLKKISLGVVGVASIGAIAFGVSKIVQFCKNDTKTLSLDYSVGALTDEGKYQEDECKLYTKKAFACEGLRVTFDFDAEVNGQFFFYDINDKFLSKSDVVTEGSSVSVPLNGAYARAVVIPTNDEDGSISFTEKYKYGSQMQVKVDKKAESNVFNKFVNYKGYNFQVVNNLEEIVFENGVCISDDFIIYNGDHYSSTTITLLNVSEFKSLSIKKGVDSIYKSDNVLLKIFEFKDLPSNNSSYSVLNPGNTSTKCEFDKGTKYILISIGYGDTSVASASNQSLIDTLTLSK